MSVSFFIYKNLLNDFVTTDPVHTENAAGESFTAVTNVSKISNRSLLDNYRFTTTGPIALSAYHTITIDLDSAPANPDKPSCFAIIGHSDLRFAIRDVVFKDSVGTVITKNNEVTDTSLRSIDGVSYKNTIIRFDQLQGVREIELTFYTSEPDPSDEEFFIGSIYLGQYIELDVSPKSVKYSFGTQGTKIRTDGGQINASRNSSYLKASFSTVATKETDVTSKYFDLCYVSSISEPIIFIPQSGQNIILYGTQEKPCSVNLVEGKKDGEWLYEAKFLLEEEF